MYIYITRERVDFNRALFNFIYRSQQPVGPSSALSSPATPSASTSSSQEAKTPASNTANKYASLSSYLGSPSDSSDTDHASPVQGPSGSDAQSSSSKNVVETILENRKKLRNCVAIGRMMRVPAVPEKKRYNSKGISGVAVTEPNRTVINGLMPTPGMPLWIESPDQEAEDEVASPTTSSGISVSNPFGNFRRQTLLRYLGSLNCSPEVKARMLDWKPEVYETKTRRQAHQVKTSTSLREIFGTEPPEKKDKKGKRKRVSSDQQLVSPVKKEVEDSPTKESPTPKRIRLTKDSPQKVKKEKVEDLAKKEKVEAVVSPEKSKRSPKKEPKDVAVQRTRSRDVDAPAKKDSGTKSKSSVTVKEEPNVKVKVEPEPKKERKKRKSKAVVNEEAQSAAMIEEMLKDAAQFYFGGAASGSMAAATLAAEAAAQRALDKEKPAYKRMPKKFRLKHGAGAAADDSDSDDYTPSETEGELQTELQNFAMDLIEANPSWERRKIIQNLVIWEYVPIDPALIPLLPPPQLVNPVLAAPAAPKPPGRRRGKKMRKHQSGLDFVKKKAPGKSSRCVSRATTPDVVVPEEVHDITYTLDHLLAETGRWVIDKSAGETILHRAAKMGYPDAAAFALDMAKMSPVMKDNAGIPPIHKAAFRGHADIVDYLLRYGADPNTNVKGTRPLHEALESGTLESVYTLLCYGSDPLLYDYSGNMPIDLAEENEEMLFYFSNLLKDLHGKKGDRWNVSHKTSFVMPSAADSEEPRPNSPNLSDFEFEITNRLPPPFYLFPDREGRFVLSADFKSSTAIDVTTKNSSKLDVVEMPREDFLRLGRCGILGVKPNPDVFKRDKVVLVRLDAAAKRLLDRADHHQHHS